MAHAYDIKKSNLPEFLGVTKGLVNNWAYYGRIPFDYLTECSEKTGVSMDWLLHGTVPDKSLSEHDKLALAAILAQVLKDGLDYGMIEENYQGALQQLQSKFEKDIAAMAVEIADNLYGVSDK